MGTWGWDPWPRDPAATEACPEPGQTELPEPNPELFESELTVLVVIVHRTSTTTLQEVIGPPPTTIHHWNRKT